jgi:hypothetical protein
MRVSPVVFASAFLACATALVIGACSKRDPVAVNARVSNLPLSANENTPDPAGLPPASTVGRASAAQGPASAVSIPPDLRGRWGLSPADCTSAVGDRKGLLIVTADGLRFYESRAVPLPDAETAGGTINGNFQFTGEGESWTRYEALKRNGDKLTRTETNPPASYTYAEC